MKMNLRHIRTSPIKYPRNVIKGKTPIDRSNINESMDRVLPRDLSDYFFFGGERISGIANRTDLTKAVRGLMGLDILTWQLTL